MMDFIQHLESTVIRYLSGLPVELFASLGGFIEEVIAPIPSPLVMATVGSIASAQHQGHAFLLWLSFLGAVGKTLGAWMIYTVADKLEDVIVGKFGRYFGVSHQEVEKIGKHFNGTRKDDAVLFLLRALPIVPSSPVSVVCGVIKINLKTYLSATLFGNIFRNLIYIYLGYAGISATQSVLSGLDNFESLLQVLIFLGLAGFVGFLYYQRKKKT